MGNYMTKIMDCSLYVNNVLKALRKVSVFINSQNTKSLTVAFCFPYSLGAV